LQYKITTPCFLTIFLSKYNRVLQIYQSKNGLWETAAPQRKLGESSYSESPDESEFHLARLATLSRFCLLRKAK